jgi:hypothetical protein
MPPGLATTLLGRVASGAVPAGGPPPDESPTADLNVRDTAIDIRPAEPRPGGSTFAPADGRKRRRRLLVVAAIVLVLAVSAALIGRMLTEDVTDRDRSGAGQTVPSTLVPSGPESAPPTSGGPRPTSSAKTKAPQTPARGVPDGFRLHRDPTGFSLAIPRGWNVSRRDHYVYVTEPDGARFLLIDQTDQPKSDAVADWTRQEAARRDSMRDYERIRIERVDYFLEAADWEFRHTRNGTRLHVVNRGFVTSKDQAYGLYWSTPDRQWDDSLRYFEVFTRTFQPAR